MHWMGQVFTFIYNSFTSNNTWYEGDVGSSGGWAPHANENISSSGNQVTTSPGVQLQPSTSIASEGDIDVDLSYSNSPHGEQYAVPNGDSTLSKNEIQSVTVPANSQQTDCNSNGQPQQTNCAAKMLSLRRREQLWKRLMSQSCLNFEEGSKLNISDSHHVVFPDHLQVPEAYKKKLTFGSFDSIWTLDGKQTSGCEVINSDDALVNDSCLASDATIAKTSTESGGVIFSTTKDAQETEDPNHLQSLPPVQANPATYISDFTAYAIQIGIAVEDVQRQPVVKPL
ncbi:hypothetical protein QQ045_016712 [Rhodiola kirilowii]